MISQVDFVNYCSMTGKDAHDRNALYTFRRGIKNKRIVKCGDCGMHFPYSYLERSKVHLDNLICPDCKRLEEKECERL